MNISKIIGGVFVITFAIGVFFAITTKKINHLVNTDSMCKMRSVLRTENEVFKDAVIKETSVVAAGETENGEIIPYEVARKFAGGEMLGEDYWERMENYKYKFDLLETGEYHGEEVSAKSGERWLAMYADKNGSYLKKTKIKVDRVPDFMLDNNKEKTGKEVSVKDKENPLFLVNAKTLKEGKFETYFRGATFEEYDEETSPVTSMEKNLNQHYIIGGVDYTLRVAEVFNKRGEINSALILESGDIKQILHITNDSSSIGELFWVGDLDRDGKPDLYLSPWIKENNTVNSLFLSSEAEKGQIVKEVASLGTVGC